ncbi:MAG: response regulator transcription factor [Gammaproteobacteria bacterium]|jgi:DNA-binding response OmpR family regulator
MKILVIEDNTDIAANIVDYFEDKGHILDYAADGITGLHFAVTHDFDVIILDLMLPGMDGLEICKKLRHDTDKNTPVLMLTARDTLEQKLQGFDSGADDYMVKPFALQELEARVTVLANRRNNNSKKVLQVGDLEYDTNTFIVKRAGNPIEMNPTGLKLLKHLMEASPWVVPRHELELKVWGEEMPDSDSLRVHIHGLRAIIDKPFEKPLIHTRHGIGYRIADLDEVSK